MISTSYSSFGFNDRYDKRPSPSAIPVYKDITRNITYKYRSNCEHFEGNNCWSTVLDHPM